MSGSPKKFSLSVVILILCSISPVFAKQGAIDGVSFSWTKILSEPAVGIDWSPAGDLIAFGNWETNQIAAVSLHAGTVAWRSTFLHAINYDPLFDTHWSPDGKSLATVSAGEVYVIDPQTGKLHSLQARDGVSDSANPYYDVHWGPDSASLAALTYDGYIDIFSLKTGAIVQTIDVAGDENLRGEGIIYQIFDWSPDGNSFAVPNYLKGVMPLTPSLGFWDRTGQVVKVQYNESVITATPNLGCSVYSNTLENIKDVQWANDSRTIAIDGDGEHGYGVCRLNINGTIDEHQISDIPGDNLRWSPDQRWLVAAGARNDGTCWLRISDAANNYKTIDEQTDVLPPCFGISLAWSPDSQHLAVGTDRGLWIGTLRSF